VTFARPAGSVPAWPVVLDRRIRRAGAFAGAGVLAALNAQADQIIGALKFQSLDDVLFQSVVQVFGGLAGISAVMWLAMYAALKIGFEDQLDRLRPTDLYVLATVIFLSFVPISYAAQAGLLLCAAYLFATSRGGDPCRRVSLMLLALTGPLLWGRVVLQIFAVPILALDAHLVGAVTGTAVEGNTVRFAGENLRMMIAGPCSSVHNMSLAIVLWTAAAALFNVRVDRAYVVIGVAMVAWMFTLNVARLTSIALFPSHFVFLHHGLGATLFGWAGLIGAGFLAGMGVVRAAERQR
jgi:hypothetical protein